MAEPWYVKAYDEHYFQVYGDEFTPAQTKAEVDGVIALLGLTAGARILDLCCGFGRHSLEFARRGYDVTGLDFSPALLGHARAAAQAENLDIAWVEADMREIPVPAEPYEAVVNLFSAFGFFDDDREEARVAEAVARVLAPGGGFLVETVNREIMLRQWMPLRWRETPNGTLLLDRFNFDSETGTLHTRELIVHPDGRRDEDAHRLRLWAFTELAALLRAAGLTAPQVFGGLDGSRYTPNSYRMAVVARRSVGD